MLSRTLKGFEIKVSAPARAPAGLQALTPTKMVFSRSCSRAPAQVLPASFEVAGTRGQLRPIISPGYGFTAIIVAFLGRLNPLGVIVAGLFLP